VKRDDRLQPPVELVRVVADVQPVDDPELLRWLGHWYEKVLKEAGAPEEGQRS
jgi:hypothetical protein